jgi:hypothetical protein
MRGLYNIYTHLGVYPVVHPIRQVVTHNGHAAQRLWSVIQPSLQALHHPLLLPRRHLISAVMSPHAAETQRVIEPWQRLRFLCAGGNA